MPDDAIRAEITYPHPPACGAATMQILRAGWEGKIMRTALLDAL